jgi:hypothetical protein
LMQQQLQTGPLTRESFLQNLSEANRVLFPVRGSSCHQCKTRIAQNTKDAQLILCFNATQGHSRGRPWGKCRKQYCMSCLTRLYSEARETICRPGWTCPACRDRCVCSDCLNKRATPKNTSRKRPHSEISISGESCSSGAPAAAQTPPSDANQEPMGKKPRSNPPQTCLQMTASDKLLAELGGATASGPRSLLPAVVSPTAAAQAPGVSFMPRQMIVLGNTIYWLVPLAVAAGTSGGNSEPSTPTSPISPLVSPTAEQKMDEAIQVVQNMNVASTQTTMQFDGRAQQVDGAGAQAIALSALLSACASRGN